MTTSLDTLRAGNGNKPAVPDNFPAMLKAYSTEIARALPKHMNGDRLARIALTEFRKNPKLGQCDPRSVFAAVIMASQLGLEPGINGQCYLIPYGKECQFIPGWKGLVDLVNRTGRSAVWTGAVFEGDDFDWALGDRPFIQHRPNGEDDPNLMTHVYAVGRVNGSEYPIIEVWPMRKVLKHRDRYNKVGGRHYSFRHPEMYARKVVLLQVIKYLPSSVELAKAMEMEHAAMNSGGQGLTDPHTVIEGTYFPVIEEDETSEPFTPEPTETPVESAQWPAPPVDEKPVTDKADKPKPAK